MSTLTPAARALQTILNLVSQRLDRAQKKSAEAVLAEKFLHTKGKIKQSLVTHQHRKEVTKELVSKNIPFQVIPTRTGCVFLFRQQHAKDVLVAEEKACRMDTRLTKALRKKDTLQAFDAQGIKAVTHISFEDNQMAMIAADILNQSGCTFSPLDKKGKDLLILPQSEFKKNAFDISLFRLQFACMNARKAFPCSTDGVQNFLDLRKKQALFDKTELLKFIDKSLKGERVSLGSIFGNGNIYIEKGLENTFLIYNKNKNKIKEISFEENDGIEDIYPVLSHFADKIYNMKTIPTPLYNQLMDEQIKINDLPTEYRDVRPPIAENDKEMKLMFDALENFVLAFNSEAHLRTRVNKNYKNMSSVECAKFTQEELENMFWNKHHKEEFLQQIKNIKLPDEVKEAYYDTFCDSFLNSTDLKLETTSLDDISKQYPEEEEEMEKEQDYREFL